MSEMSDTLIPSVRETYMGIDLAAQPTGGDHGSRALHTGEDTDAGEKISPETDSQDHLDTASISTWELSEDEGTIIDLLDSMSVV